MSTSKDQSLPVCTHHHRVNHESPGGLSIVDIPDQGAVQGCRDVPRSLNRYLGIPYAVVTKRWRKACPVEPWLGVRDATRPGPMCPQPLVKKETHMTKLMGLPTVNDGFMYSERDCLNLDIYTPMVNNKPVEGVPVIVLLHGGRLRHGGNSHPMFDASNFVQASVRANLPVVVVVPNYRLGYLGFFACKELAVDFDSDPDNILQHRTHDQDPDYGNWGLSDQKLAFEWVRNNIEAFGGCPSKVTAMGYSCGGSTIMNHMRIKSHHGLFSQAIIHSGPTGVFLSKYAHVHSQMTFDHLYNRFKAEMIQPLDPSGNHSSSKLMRTQTLRDIPAEILVQAPEVPGFDGWICFLLDNKILYPSPASALAWNPSLYDPGVKSVIIGTTKDEGTLFTRTLGATNVRQWQPCLDRLVDQSLHHEAEAIYGKPQTDAEAQSISTKILAARSSEYPTHALCEGMLAQQGTQRQVHRYYIDRPLEAMERLRISPGVPHGTEMAFTLMSDLGQRYMTEEEKEFGHRVMEKYIRFVHGYGFTPMDTTDAVSSVQSDSIAQEHGAKSERVAIIWSKDLKFQTGPFERLDERTLDFWRRNEELELKAQSRFHRSFQEIHSKL